MGVEHFDLRDFFTPYKVVSSSKYPFLRRFYIFYSAFYFFPFFRSRTLKSVYFFPQISVCEILLKQVNERFLFVCLFSCFYLYLENNVNMFYIFFWVGMEGRCLKLFSTDKNELRMSYLVLDILINYIFKKKYKIKYVSSIFVWMHFFVLIWVADKRLPEAWNVFREYLVKAVYKRHATDK